MEKVQFVQTKRICRVPLEGGGIYSLCHNIDFHRKYTVSLSLYIYIQYLYIYIILLFIIKNHTVVAGAKGLVKRVFQLTNAWKAKEYEPPRPSKSFGELWMMFFLWISSTFPVFFLVSPFSFWVPSRTAQFWDQKTWRFLPQQKTPLQRWSRKCHTLWRIAMWHSQWRSFDCWAPIMCANTQLGRNMVPTKQKHLRIFLDKVMFELMLAYCEVVVSICFLFIPKI